MEKETRNEKECIGSGGGGSDSTPPKGVESFLILRHETGWGGIFSHTSWESENQTLFFHVSLPFVYKCMEWCGQVGRPSE